jgi:AraC-like DNA-binding protein
MFQFIAPPLPHYIVCGEDTYPAGGGHPNRSNIGVFDILFVERGCLYLEEEQHPFAVDAGSYLILRPDRSHRTLEPCREETCFYWLHFQTLGRWAEMPDESLEVPAVPNIPYAQLETFPFYLPRFFRLSNPAPVTLAFQQLLRLQKERHSYSYWKRQKVFNEMLDCLQEEAGRLNPGHLSSVAEKAADYLRQRYSASISYKEMAQALHFHPNYIALCMKKVFGCTPLQYLLSYRIEQAKQMLIHTDDSIRDIAERSGFKTSPYLSRVFKQLTGTTPSSFRQKFRPGRS